MPLNLPQSGRRSSETAPADEKGVASEHDIKIEQLPSDRQHIRNIRQGNRRVFIKPGPGMTNVVTSDIKYRTLKFMEVLIKPIQIC